MSEDQADIESDIHGESNVVVQQIRGVQLDIRRQSAFRGNIIIQAVDGTQINIAQYLSRSEDYQKLIQEIRALESAGDAQNALPVESAMRLNALLEIERRFRDDVARLAGTFAAISIDTERLRKAREYFEAGRIHEADEILNPGDLEREQETLFAERAKNQAAAGKYDEDLKTNACEFLVKARLVGLNHDDPQRLPRARKLFEKSLQSAEMLENCAAFARFLSGLNDHENARKLLERALELCEGELARADACRELGDALAATDRRAEAILKYEQAGEIYRGLDHRRELARVLDRLGRLYLAGDDPDASRGAVEEALDLLENVRESDRKAASEKIDPELMLLRAELWEGRAKLYGNERKIEAAIQDLSTALELRTEVRNARGGYAAGEDLEAGWAANLCEQTRLRLDLERVAPALESLNQALPVLEFLAAKNPLAYEGALAHGRVLRGRIHALCDESESIETQLLPAIRSFERLAEKNPASYSARLAEARLHLAEWHAKNQAIDPALRQYKPALLIYENLTANDPVLYKAWLARAQAGFARLVMDASGDSKYVNAQLDRALALSSELFEHDPGKHAPLHARVLCDLALYRGVQLSREKAASPAAKSKISRALAEADAALERGRAAGGEQAGEAEHPAYLLARARLNICRRDLSILIDERDRPRDLLREALRLYLHHERRSGRSLAGEIGAVCMKLATSESLPQQGRPVACVYARRAVRRLLPICEKNHDARANCNLALVVLYMEGYSPEACVARLRGETHANTSRGERPRLRPGWFARMLIRLGLKKEPGPPDFSKLLARWIAPPQSPPQFPPVLAPQGKTPAPAVGAGATHESAAENTERKIDIREVRGGRLEIPEYGATHTGIEIQNVSNADINITQYLSRSGEYSRLEERIADARRRITEAEAAPESVPRALYEELDRLIRLERQFRDDVTRLADTFQRVALDTERLQQARVLFEQGRFSEADAIFQTEELERNQTELLLEQDRLKSRAEDISQKLKNNANEFQVKANLTLLRYDLEDRFIRARQYYEASLRATRTYENLFDFAVFLGGQREPARAIECYEGALEFPLNMVQRLGVLNNMAALLSMNNDFERSLKIFEQIIDIKEQIVRDTPEYGAELATTYQNLAILQKNNQQIDAAVAAARRSTELFEAEYKRRPEPMLIFFAHSLCVLALILKRAEKFDEGAKAARKAIKLLEAAPADESRGDHGGDGDIRKDFLSVDSCRAQALTELVGISIESEEFSVAAGAIEEAIAVWELLYKRNPRYFGHGLSVILENHALLLQHEEKASAAIERLHRVLELREELFSASPEAYGVHLARTHCRLGRAYEARQSEDSAGVEKALSYYRQAVELQERDTLRNPAVFAPELLASLRLLTEAIADRGDYKTALPLCERRVTVARMVGDADELFNALLALGICYDKTGDPEAAQTFWLEALAICEAAPEPFAPDCVEVLGRLAESCLERGDFSDGEKYYDRVIPYFRKCPPHPVFVHREARLVDAMVRRYHDTDRLDLAGQGLERSVELYETLTRLVPGNFEIALGNSLLDLAGHYIREKARRKAGDTLERALQFAQEWYARDADFFDDLFVDCLYTMGDFCLETDSKNEAGGFFLQAIEVLEKKPATRSESAHSLRVAAEVYSKFSQILASDEAHRQALDSMRKALQFRRILVQAGSEGDRMTLGGELAFTAASAYNVGGPEAAREYVQEAVTLLYELEQEGVGNPKLFEMCTGILEACGVDAKTFLRELKS